MIRLETILTPGRSLVNVPGGSKKKALEQIANLIAGKCRIWRCKMSSRRLIAREKLGSTGFGNGIAIPHCRLKGCEHPSAPCCTWMPHRFRRHRRRTG
jgi:PTS system nitrogen regulatory IIA component